MKTKTHILWQKHFFKLVPFMR